MSTLTNLVTKINDRSAKSNFPPFLARIYSEIGGFIGANFTQRPRSSPYLLSQSCPPLRTAVYTAEVFAVERV
eukprot:scaffold1239_cov175-Pinguiococcus_pyrenoidosus.AAC.46